METSTRQQPEPGVLAPEPSLGAGSFNPWPNFAHGRASTLVTARARKQERCPRGVPGFGHCPAALEPLMHAVCEGNGHPTGTWGSRGDRGGCSGALGIFPGCADAWARVWLGAVWVGALHPPGQVWEDNLDQLSVGFGFLS